MVHCPRLDYSRRRFFTSSKDTHICKLCIRTMAVLLVIAVCVSLCACDTEISVVTGKKVVWLVQEQKLYMDGALYETISYEYDTKGNMVKARIVYSDSSLEPIELTYENDAYGNCVKTTYYSTITGNTELRSASYTYDGQGNIVAAVIKTEFRQGKDVHLSYAYDSRGNIIYESVSVDGESYTAELREDGEHKILRIEYGGEITEYIADYDESGKVLQLKGVISNGEIVHRVEKPEDMIPFCEYENGNLVRLVYGDYANFQCQYDSMGNMVHMMSVDDNGTVLSVGATYISMELDVKTANTIARYDPYKIIRCSVFNPNYLQIPAQFTFPNIMGGALNLTDLNLLQE